MAASDGSVVLNTPGKTAYTGTGSGTGQVYPVAARKSVKGPGVVRVKGRKAVSRSAR